MHAVVDETSIVLFSTGKKYHTVSIAGNKIIDSVWGLTHDSLSFTHTIPLIHLFSASLILSLVPYGESLKFESLWPASLLYLSWGLWSDN